MVTEGFGELGAELGLVGLDGENILAASLPNAFDVLAVHVECVGGDDCAAQIRWVLLAGLAFAAPAAAIGRPGTGGGDGVQQRQERGELAGVGGDRALGRR